MVGMVAVERSGQHVVVRARGEFDLSTVPALEPALREAADAGCDVDLDLTETSFVDVVFLRVVFELQETLHSRGHRLTVVHPPPSLLRMVAALKLSKLMIA
jgi:anti-anti-sigma factor